MLLFYIFIICYSLKDYSSYKSDSSSRISFIQDERGGVPVKVCSDAQVSPNTICK